MEISKDFKEFIELLNEHKVKYLIIGGYAVNYHGYSRYTRDIDFWIWMTDENIKHLLSAIRAFGFGTLGLSESDFFNPENIVQLGYEPHRIDLLVDLNGVDFDKCYSNREEVEYDGLKFHFLGFQDLIEAKKNAGRMRDLGDVEELEKLKEKKNKPEK